VGLRTNGSELMMRLEPVLVLETVLRGTKAQVKIAAADQAVLGLPGVADLDAHGSGDDDDIGNLDVDALATRLQTLITAGPVAPPTGLAATASVGRLSVTKTGTAALNFSKSSGRVAEVLTAGWDATNNRVRFTGALPLSTGHISVDAGDWKARLLAAPATVTLPFGSFGTPIESKKLVVTLRGQDQTFRFQPEDTNATLVAARILTTAEGLRAWASGTNVILQTVAAGSSLTLNAALNGAAPVVGTGDTPANLRTNNLITDSTAIQQATLIAAITDELAQAAEGHTTPFTVTHAANAPIVLGGGAAISFTASQAVLAALGTGAVNSPAGTPASLNVGTTVPSKLSLVAPGWIDVVVDSKKYRLPIEGEPARLALDVRNIPTGEVKITINGGQVTVNVAPTTNSLAALVYELNKKVSGLIARIAYRYAFETERHGPRASLTANGDGVPGAGLLSTVVAFGRGSYLDAALGLAGGLSSAPTVGGLGSTAPSASVAGPLVTPCTVSPPGVSPVTLSVPSGTLTLSEEFGPNGFVPAGAPTPLPIFTQSSATTWVANIAGSGVALPRESVGYQITVADAADTAPGTLSIGHFEINAAAAHITGVNPISITSPANTLLSVTTISPGAGSRTITGSVDVSGATSVEDLVARLQRDLPHVECWLVAGPKSAVYSPDSGDRLHMRTRGGGTGWQLVLVGANAVAALGFDPQRLVTTVTASGSTPFNQINLTGKGNVVDGRNVTPDEIRTILTDAVKLMTQQQNQAFDVKTLAGTGDLQLSAAGRTVTLDTVPPSVRPRFTNVGPAPGNALHIAAENRDLDNCWLLVRVDGTLAAAAPVFGARAHIDSPLGATPDNDVVSMQTAAVTIDVIVDGTGLATPYTVTVGTLSALLDALAKAQPRAWFGRVGASGGTLRVESRTRGTSSQVKLVFTSTTTWPGPGLLGFTSPTPPAATGSGTVGSLAAVTVGELSTLLGTYAGVSEQALLQCDALASGLQVTARSTGGAAAAVVTLAQSSAPRPSAAPLPFAGGVTLAAVPGRVDQLAEAASGYTAPRDVDPGLLSISANGANVNALVSCNPARLEGLGFPATITALNGTTLALTVDGAAVSATFTAITGPPDVIRQLEAQTQFKVRARTDAAGKLTIETFHEGRTAQLAFATPSSGTDARTKLIGGGGTGTGSGIADDSSRMTPTEFASAFASGYVSVAWVDASSYDAVAVKRPYDSYQYFFGPAGSAGGTGTSTTPTGGAIPTAPTGIANPYTVGNFRQIQLGNRARFRSQIDGCVSSVIPLVDAPAFNFERSLQRAPAVRASVAVGPWGAAKAMTGRLVILLDDNGPSADVAPPVTVNVDFGGEQYDGQQFADKVNAALFGRGVGCAARFDDDVIVIETLTPGIAGSIELPAAGSDAAMGGLLGLGATVAKARGWPGAGQKSGFITTKAATAPAPAGTAAQAPSLVSMPNGFRSGLGPPKANVLWTFTFTSTGVGPATVTYTITATDTIDTIAANVDAAMRAPASVGQRVGLCKKGVDGALYVETMPGFSVSLTSSLGGTATTASGPTGDSIWQAGIDVQPEPGLDLQRTDLLRTYRFCYDRNGDGGTALVDLKWVRPPSNPSGAALFVPYMPDACFLVGARAEGSRPDGYKPPGEMVLSSGVAGTIGSDNNVPVIHQVQYWVEATSGGNLAMRLLGIRRTGSESLPYMVNPR
jgi:hypothetical protein